MIITRTFSDKYITNYNYSMRTYAHLIIFCVHTMYMQQKGNQSYHIYVQMFVHIHHVLLVPIGKYDTH